MFALSFLLWFGIGLLYVGFAAVPGVLLHLARKSGSPHHWLLLSLHTTLIFIPATVLVLGLNTVPEIVRLAMLGSGALALGVSARQPTWAPLQLWQVHFGRRYFSFAMAISGAWALVTAWLQPDLGPAILAGAAIAASLSSMIKVPSNA